MEIRVAKTAGFCFGVKRAVDLTYGLLNEGCQKKQGEYHDQRLRAEGRLQHGAHGHVVRAAQSHHAEQRGPRQADVDPAVDDADEDADDLQADARERSYGRQELKKKHECQYGGAVKGIGKVFIHGGLHSAAKLFQKADQSVSELVHIVQSVGILVRAVRHGAV